MLHEPFVIRGLRFDKTSLAVAHDWRIRDGLILRHLCFRGVDGFGLLALVLGFVLLWRHVAKCLVNPLVIIKHFDVLENARPGIGQIDVGMMIRPLLFQ